MINAEIREVRGPWIPLAETSSPVQEVPERCQEEGTFLFASEVCVTEEQVGVGGLYKESFREKRMSAFTSRRGFL